MKNFPTWFFDKADWQEKTFADIFEDVSEKNFPDLEVLTIMQGYGTIPRKNSGIDIKFTEESKKNYKKVSAGDFIIHLRSFQGGFEMANSEGIVSPAYTILKNKLPIAKYFYKTYFRSYKFIFGKLAKVVEGIRDGRQINYSQLKSVKIPFPPLETQKKIADYFTSLDNAINAQDLKLKSWRDAKKAMLQKIFAQEFYFTQDNGEKYPAWQEKTLGDVLKIFHGKDYKNLNPGKYPVIGTGEILNYVDDFNCDWACALIGRKGTINKPKFMDKPFWAIDTIFYTKAYEGNEPKFQYYLFQNIDWEKYSENGNRPSLTASIIENIFVKIPCVEEQKKIADYFSSFDKIIDAENKILENLRLMKRGLLQKLFV